MSLVCLRHYGSVESPQAHKRTRRTVIVRTVVVDNHVFMRELIGARLSRERSRFKIVAEVGDAGGAVAACRTFSPDLIILDINLPDRSGIDLMTKLGVRNMAAMAVYAVHTGLVKLPADEG